MKVVTMIATALLNQPTSSSDDIYSYSKDYEQTDYAYDQMDDNDNEFEYAPASVALSSQLKSSTRICKSGASTPTTLSSRAEHGDLNTGYYQRRGISQRQLKQREQQQRRIIFPCLHQHKTLSGRNMRGSHRLCDLKISNYADFKGKHQQSPSTSVDISSLEYPIEEPQSTYRAIQDESQEPKCSKLEMRAHMFDILDLALACAQNTGDLSESWKGLPTRIAPLQVQKRPPSSSPATPSSKGNVLLSPDRFAEAYLPKIPQAVESLSLRRRLILPSFWKNLPTGFVGNSVPQDTKLQPQISLPSCLRSKSISCIPSKQHETVGHVAKVSSVESDIPSLASSNVSLCSTEEPVSSSPARSSILKQRRCVSEPLPSSNSISFNPTVVVREFARSKFEAANTWYTETDMDRFKMEAIECIRKYRETMLVPTGTGRMVQTRSQVTIKNATAPQDCNKSFFSHDALQLDSRLPFPGLAVHKTQMQASLMRKEIRNILIVDPHDTCRQLFSKSFKLIAPKASITMSKSIEETLQICSSQAMSRYDIVIVEQRIQANSTSNHGLQCGSDLLRELQQRMAQNHPDHACLWIGTSWKLVEDQVLFVDAGADLCWSKPPPSMNDDLQHNLLVELLKKRHRHIDGFI